MDVYLFFFFFGYLKLKLESFLGLYISMDGHTGTHIQACEGKKGHAC